MARSDPALSPAALAAVLAPLDLPGRLALIARHVPGRIVLSVGFGREGQAILDAAARAGVAGAFDIVTLDTGRLFEETHALWAETEARYGLEIRAITPEAYAVAALVAAQGANGFRDGVIERVACCAVRKVAPLARVLEGAGGWITGLRAEQSPGRARTALAEEDARGFVKLNPLADWDRAMLDAYLEANAVPVSPLHAAGFASIGCAPCTRAIAPGEEERAGRWWWEASDKKECGIHNRPRPALALAA